MIIPEPAPLDSCVYCLPNQSVEVDSTVIFTATIPGITLDTISDTSFESVVSTPAADVFTILTL